MWYGGEYCNKAGITQDVVLPAYTCRREFDGLGSQAWLMKHEQDEDEEEGAPGRETEVVGTER